MNDVVWAEPRNVGNIDECYFYHTMEIPNHGVVQGEWDLRGREAPYLGFTSFQKKRVLEIGTASGHLCFYMERMGAEVVAYDLSDEQEWDSVPYAGYDYRKEVSRSKHHLRRINNGFWLAHRAYNSHARVAYGTAYDIPHDIGQFDICIFGSILLHLRDPFLALQRATAHVRETAIVTDGVPTRRGRVISIVEDLTGVRLLQFLPNADKLEPYDTWWNLSPKVVSEFLRILGFRHTKITFHRQKFKGKEFKRYTVVGQR